MSDVKSRRFSWLVYCVVAVVLFGSWVLVTGFREDNSATMAPNLTFNR